MIHEFEKEKFIKGWLLISIIFFVPLGVFLKLFGYNNIVVGIMLLLLVLADAVLFLFSYVKFSNVIKEVKRASDIMIDVVEEKEEILPEEYKEGTIGVLYTNMYKMISSLKESKQKELNEKIFLRDIIQDISHQLKTPLASLNVFVDLLLDESFDDEERKNKMLEESKNQLNRMEWMVLAMLKLARIEAGAVVFNKTNQNLLGIIAKAVDGVSYLSDARNQHITVKCSEDLYIECDGDWLTEAVINLLKNASDYSDNDKNIDIEVEETEAFTRIYITDYGMGISEDDIPNIFNRFYRVNHQVNPNSIGIGLSLTKSIIQGMGGNITVRSELGKYTTFRITFVNM